jgi:hypothetical protein
MNHTVIRILAAVWSLTVIFGWGIVLIQVA